MAHFSSWVLRVLARTHGHNSRPGTSSRAVVVSLVLPVHGVMYRYCTVRNQSVISYL
jgi:hypothetical protein